MQAKFEMKLILLMILNVFTAKLEEESITPHEDSKCEFHTASLKFSSISNKSSVQSGSTIPWVSKHEAYFFTASSPDKDNHELRVCKNCYSQFELFQSVLDCVKNEKYKTTHSFLPSSLKGYKVLKKTHNDIESVLFLVLEVDPNKEKQNSIMEVDVAIEESEVQKVQKMYYLLVSNEHGRLFALKVVPFDNKPEGSKYKWIIENFNLVSLEKIPNKWTSGIANVEIGEVSVPMNFEEMYRSRR